MTAYVIGQLQIHDPTAYQAYLDGFMDTFTPFEGSILATSLQTTTLLEGAWATPRTVLLSFPSRTLAQPWFDSPAYQNRARIRRATATTNLVLVNGTSEHNA